MQTSAFMLITMICFFMPIRTCPEWADSQRSAYQVLITVRRSFIWRTFIYSFNFLSFMCSAHTSPWRGSVLSGMHRKFLIGKCLWGFHYILWLNGKLYFLEQGITGSPTSILRDFCLRFSQFFPSVERPLALPVFQAASMSDIVQIILLLPVSQSQAGREGCFDRTCKSILFSGKHRLIPQWLDSCLVVVVWARPPIWLGWY